MDKSKDRSNYFSVSRGLLESDRWLDEPFTRAQAWVDLFGLANYKDGFFRIRGIRIDVKRGQLARSQVMLAQRWKWSRGKVIRYLSELARHQDIVQQKNEVITLITIVKYDLWQAPIGQQVVQQTDSKRYTYNKNIRKNVLDTNVSTDSAAQKSGVNTRNLLRELITTLGYSDQVRITDGRLRQLKIRLRTYKPDELITAATNVAADDFMQGENQSGKRYGTIDYLLRKDEVVDKWLVSDKQVTYQADW